MSFWKRNGTGLGLGKEGGGGFAGGRNGRERERGEGREERGEGIEFYAVGAMKRGEAVRGAISLIFFPLRRWTVEKNPGVLGSVFRLFSMIHTSQPYSPHTHPREKMNFPRKVRGA